MLKYGNLVINPATRSITVNGQELRLTSQEGDVLFYLAANAGKTFSQRAVLAGIGSPADPKLVDVQICKARKKIALAGFGGVLIENVWGQGYTIPKPGQKKTA